MDVERTFTVERGLEEAFDFLSDFENAAIWDPGTLETTRTSGDGGVGTTYLNRSRFLGRTVELEYETVALDRPDYFACRGRNGRTVATDHMTFTPKGTRTRIRYRAVFDFPFPVSVLAPLARRRIEKIGDETVARIKQVLGG